MHEQSDYERIGGAAGLRAIIESFVARVFDDVMIGFLFHRAERGRLTDKEFELAAAHLGADVEYTGRPLAEAHRRHRIFGGQFDRRATILRQVLSAHQVPGDIAARWLAWTEAQRGLITGGVECNSPAQGS